MFLDVLLTPTEYRLICTTTTPKKFEQIYKTDEGQELTFFCTNITNCKGKNAKKKGYMRHPLFFNWTLVSICLPKHL